MSALVAVLAAVVALLTLLVVGLLRSHAEILRRLHQLDGGAEVADVRTASGDHGFQVRPGTPAPGDRDGFTPAHDVSGVGVTEDAVAVGVVGARHDTVLAFLSSGCLTCARFWEELGDPELALPDRTRLVVITKDPGEESPSKIAALAPTDKTVLMSSAAWTDYDVPGSPYFVLVDGPAGAVRGEGTGLSWEQVSGLLAQATDDLAFEAGDAGLRVSKPDADAAREARIDRELLAAGIRPGDESLDPQPPVDGESKAAQAPAGAADKAPSRIGEAGAGKPAQGASKAAQAPAGAADKAPSRIGEAGAGKPAQGHRA